MEVLDAVARYFERLGDHACNVTRRVPATHADLAGWS